MLLRRVAFPDFCEPRLPSPAAKPPAGARWLHEIKHDGFRIIARENGAQLRLYSRPANELTRRFPLIVDAPARLRSRSTSSMAKLSPAITTASSRSISSGTIVLRTFR
jgi:ATP-dependent DNA ligase